MYIQWCCLSKQVSFLESMCVLNDNIQWNNKNSLSLLCDVEAVVQPLLSVTESLVVAMGCSPGMYCGRVRRWALNRAQLNPLPSTIHDSF